MENTNKKQFHWTTKVTSDHDDGEGEEEEERPCRIFKTTSLATILEENKKERKKHEVVVTMPRRKLPGVAVSARVRFVLSALGRNYRAQFHHHPGAQLGSRVVGTLFGQRRGNVHFAFQKEPSSPPVLLVELATPITVLVKEMASGLVRIALECEKERANNNHSNKNNNKKGKCTRLLEEPVWRTYCNGKKCGYARRIENGVKEMRILKAVEPISMGAGVLPAGEDGGDVMYMRAKFERVVGSRDSEAFYMKNPDSNGAPELSIYLLRV